LRRQEDPSPGARVADLHSTTTEERGYRAEASSLVLIEQTFWQRRIEVAPDANAAAQPARFALDRRRTNRTEACCRTTTAGNDDLFSRLRPIHQGGQTSLRIVNVDFLAHWSDLVNLSYSFYYFIGSHCASRSSNSPRSPP